MRWRLRKSAGAPLDVEQVYREHHDFVWRTLRHGGVPPDAVDDATQEVFIVVHRRRGDYQSSRSLRGWLFGISRNVARKYHSRRTKDRTASAEGSVEPATSAVGPEQAVALGEAASLVEAILDVLEPGQRTVFVLAEIEQMTAPEIAEVVGLKLNTVYSRLRLARARFERELSRRMLEAETGRQWIG